MTQTATTVSAAPISGDVQKGFRLRGSENTRIEIFTDAAFAFALTMLVISIDNIPANLPELVRALKDAPAFAASFALIMLYWRGHQVWSQRYGLEDLPTVLLSCLLIFVVMIYVYPLKILFSSMFYVASGGWLPVSFELESYTDLRQLFLIYSSGFMLLNLPLILLYIHAWRKRKVLQLNRLEREITRNEIIAWLTVGGFGALSVVLAWVLPNAYLPLSAWLYCLLAVVMPLLAVYGRRRERRQSD